MPDLSRALAALPSALRTRLAVAALGGALSLAVSLVGYFEGRSLVPYLDPVAIPTVCDGVTGVDMARVYTGSDCDALTRDRVSKALAAVDRDVHVPLGDPTRAALASFVFNVGEAKFRASTLVGMLNAGQGPPACDQLMRWTHAGGRELPGLVKRRRAERALCIAGFEGMVK